MVAAAPTGSSEWSWQVGRERRQHEGELGVWLGSEQPQILRSEGKSKELCRAPTLDIMDKRLRSGGTLGDGVGKPGMASGVPQRRGEE